MRQFPKIVLRKPGLCAPETTESIVRNLEQKWKMPLLERNRLIGTIPVFSPLPFDIGGEHHSWYAQHAAVHLDTINRIIERNPLQWAKNMDSPTVKFEQ